MFFCNATLSCLKGQEVNGEGQTDKEAEQNAALAGIAVLEEEIANKGYSCERYTPELPDTVKAAAVQAGLCSSEGEASVDNLPGGEGTVKAMLHAILTKIVGRKLEKGDLEYTYTTDESTGLHTAGLRMKAIGGKLGETEFQGEVSAFKRDSQLACALKAMDTILSDEAHSTIDLKGAVHIKDKAADKRNHRAAKREKAQESGTGKGKGKGKKGKMMIPPWLLDWSFGAGGKGGPDLPREPVGEALVQGEVTDWKGNFGWIKPSSSIDHPAASRRDGKVYVHKQDLQGVEALEQGATVKFKVYADSSGLGAAEVVVA